MYRSLVARSKLKRHGLRNPLAQIKPNGSAAVGFGLLSGTARRVLDVDIDPQDLSKQRRIALAVPAWIVLVAPVSHADVQIAVGSECELTAIVIGERLVDG